MLPSGFSLTPQSLRQAADELENYALNLSYLGTQVSEMVDRTSPHWMGMSAQQLITRYQQSRSVIEAYPERYRNLAEYLRKTADDFELADRAQKQEVTYASYEIDEVRSDLERQKLEENIEDRNIQIADLQQEKKQIAEDLERTTRQNGIISTISGIAAVGGLASCLPTVGIGCAVAGIGGLVGLVASSVFMVEDAEVAVKRVNEINQEITRLEQEIADYETQLKSISNSGNLAPSSVSIIELQSFGGLSYIAA